MKHHWAVNIFEILKGLYQQRQIVTIDRAKIAKAKVLEETARLCANNAAYAFERLVKIPGVKPRFKDKWFFNEFVLDLPCEAGDVIASLVEKGFAAGFPLSRYYREMENSILICVTEKRTRQEIGMLAEALEGALCS